MNRTAGFSLVLSIIILIESGNTIPFKQKFLEVAKIRFYGGSFEHEKSHSSPGGRVIFSHENGNFTPGPW